MYSHGLSVLMQILYDVGWNLIDARINDVSFNRNDLEVCFGLTNVVNGVENIVDINICLDNQAQHDFVIINEKRYAFETPIQSMRKRPARFMIERFVLSRRDYIYDYFDEFYSMVFSNGFSQLMDKTIEIDEKIYVELSNELG